MGILDAPARVILPAETIVWAGDSITYNGGGLPTNISYKSNGFWCWAQFFLGHAFRTLYNAGVTGDKTADLLARFSTDVLAYSPGWCHLLIGSNDVSNAVPVATIKANITSMLDQLAAHQIRAIIGTIPPHSTYTGTMLADTYALNAWIRQLQQTRKGVIVVDYHAVLSDPVGTGWYTDGNVAFTPDGVHPGNAGAPRMGKVLADRVAPLVGSTVWPFGSEGDPYNCLNYGEFTQGSVGSGTPPTGWNESSLANGPVVYSRVARPDLVPGSRLVMTLPNTCHLKLQNPNSFNSGRWSVGDVVVGVLEVSATSLDQAPSASSMGKCLQVIAQTANVGSPTDLFWTNGSADNQCKWDHVGLMMTPPFTIPATTTGLTLQLELGGGGTYALGRAGILNVTKLGLVA